MSEDLAKVVEELACEAKEASTKLATTSIETRNRALCAMAWALRDETPHILKANKADMESAKDQGVKESLLDRLMLDSGRINDMADALLALSDLDDPLGDVLEERVLYNGINLKRVSVPLGVVAIVFEARPNVTADAAGICIKSGNACVLRGGSLAFNSNKAISDVLSRAASEAGLPEHSIQNISSRDRSATDALMQLHGIVDVLIPRGGAGLIKHCVETSKVPVIETGTGNCHVYVHASADLDKAREIILNAKCRRFGVCNAAETLLVDRSIARAFLPETFSRLAEKGVVLHCDEEALASASWTADTAGRAGVNLLFEPATEYDWATEYLGPELAVKCVDSVEEAIAHINHYGTHHSESIVATDRQAIDLFLKCVDSAAVYANASTAFTDGGQFGLGAEIGISTQKLHVRGPFALKALTSSKYVLEGDGQIRE